MNATSSTTKIATRAVINVAELAITTWAALSTDGALMWCLWALVGLQVAANCVYASKAYQREMDDQARERVAGERFTRGVL